jgi:hypothetical protein
MSDVKPKRPSRGTEVSEIALIEALPSATIPPLSAEQSSDSGAASEMVAEAVRDVERAEAAAEDAWSVWAEAQGALARGFELAALEMTGMARAGMTASAEAAMALLGVRSFAAAVEINTGLACRSFDTIVAGSAKLSQIGADTAAEAAKPFLHRFGGAWSGIAAA